MLEFKNYIFYEIFLSKVWFELSIGFIEDYRLILVSWILFYEVEKFD